MQYRARLFALILLLPLLQGFAPAQVTGLYDFGPFDSPGFDTINRGNLNSHFSIPIFSKPGRGGDTFTYSLNYDGLIWVPTGSTGSQTWLPVTEWGWTDVTNAQYGYLTYNMSINDCTLPPHGIDSQYSSYTGFVYHDNKGNSHKIQYSFTNQCGKMTPPPGTSTIPLTDNSGYTIYRNLLTFTVFTKFGAQFSVPTYMLSSDGYSTQKHPGAATAQDTNGNQISASSTGVFTDTMGKTALTVSGSAPNPVVYTYTDSNGHAQTVTVNYTPYTVQTAFGASGISEYSQTSVPLVSSIVYSADNSSYSFSYEATPGGSGPVTGRIKVITLRTGGTITYSYTGGNNGIETDGTTAGLTRTTSDGLTSYVRSGVTSSQSTTTFTDAASNATISSFLVNSSGYFFETDRATYQGAATGTPLTETQTCYNTTQSSCSGNSVTSAISSVLRYANNNGSQVDQDYQQYSGPGLLQQEYDSATSTTAYYTYNAFTGPYSITFYRLSSTYTSVGSNTSSKTTYGYDETTPTTTSGLPQHVVVSTSRGNLTSSHQWTNSSGSPTINNTFAYDDAGQLLSQTDTNSDTTSFSYDSSTDTLLTGITYPLVNGNRFSATVQMDPNTGLLSSVSDLNSQLTSYSYDGLMRPTQVLSPDGGKTTYSYTPIQTSQFTYQNSSTYSDTETLFDGYGRQSRLAVSNGQTTNPWYQQDVCYDANGNLSFSSYRYQGNEWSSGKVCSGSGGDAYTYDALRRILTIHRGDNTSVSYSYNIRTTKAVDENGVIKLVSVLAPRLISKVCEISSNANMPGSGSPASCGLDISGTGFLTSYAYDLVNHKVTVTQGAQTRVFQTDWAARPTLIQEPESGQTSFTYAYNSTGLQVTRQRPKANQQNSSVLTTTTTQYDALGRVASIGYSDGTPTKSFAYDATTGVSTGTGANFTDLTQANLKGRLSLASISGSSGTAYSYDPMGRASYLDQCLPTGCGTVVDNRQLHYTYDLAGDLLTSTDGGGTTSTYTTSLAGEAQSITSSLSNSTNPAGIISSVKNGPNGPVSYNLGNGLSAVYGYDTLGRLNGGWVCNGSTSANCTGGTQSYGFSNAWKGVQLTGSSDTVLNQAITYGYDEFNRLTSRTVNTGASQNFTYVYDRWGNRWQQNITAGTGPTSSISFNTSTNQINTSGYAYDAAGNLTNDTFHTYTYDAEGNVTAVDGGSTATYVYDALNHRVRTTVASTAADFVFNANGQRVSVWNGSTKTQLRGQYYLGAKPVGFYLAGGAAQFQHQDWLGTERMRTTYNGTVEGSFTSLPFGDGYSASGTDSDPSHFATLDHDYESDTDHAQFRQFSNAEGRWLSHDPFNGSYDFTNPQSLNRYEYVANNPLSSLDPSGLQHCSPASGNSKFAASTWDSTCATGNLDSDASDLATEFSFIPTQNVETAYIAIPTQSATTVQDAFGGTLVTTISVLAEAWVTIFSSDGTSLNFPVSGNPYTGNTASNPGYVLRNGYCSTLSCHSSNYQTHGGRMLKPASFDCVTSLEMGVLGYPELVGGKAALALWGTSFGMNIAGIGCEADNFF
jgi:RHS repeat-associated protein